MCVIVHAGLVTFFDHGLVLWTCLSLSDHRVHGLLLVMILKLSFPGISIDI